MDVYRHGPRRRTAVKWRPPWALAGGMLFFVVGGTRLLLARSRSREYAEITWLMEATGSGKRLGY